MAMMEEIAFSEWHERLDIVGSNHWLPAYGYQQPTQLQQALLQQQDRDAELLSNDGGAVLIAGQQPQQFLFLETIVEETSDDLRSESDRSGPAGWLDSDSDTESVIHVTNSLDSCETAEWSGSERDLAVPKKRRRRTDVDVELEDAEPETTSLSSRSSSLLQFECLERHCEDVFRTSASSDPFAFPPPSPSTISFDSLESTRWRFSTSPDSLDGSNSSDDGASSDDTLQHSSHSSWSSRGRLRSYRSFDSLNLLQQQQQQPTLAELSQSLGGNSLTQHDLSDKKLLCQTADLSLTEARVKNADSNATIVNEDVSVGDGGKESGVELESKPQRSAENLSEDSGFGDHIPTTSCTSTRTNTIVPIVEDDDSCSSYYSDCSAGSSSGGGGGNSEASSSDSSSSSDEKKQQVTLRKTVAKKVLKLGDELEFRHRRGWEAQQAKFNSNCWQSAPNLFSSVFHETRSGQHQSRCLSQDLCSVPDNLNLCSNKEKAIVAVLRNDENLLLQEEEEVPLETKSFINMASRLPVVSTPNLVYTTNKDFLKHEQEFSTTSTISVPLNDDEDMYLDNEPILSKSLTPLPGSVGKGVHFCPVVSEVSWRDSYSEDDPQEAHDDSMMDGDMEEELKAEEEEEERRPMVFQKLQIGVPIGPEERERVVMDLNDGRAPPITGPPTVASHVVSTPSTAAVAPAMASKQVRGPSESPSESSSKKSTRFGGFFQRFSLRRLSGRGDAKKEKKKEKLKSKEAVVPKVEAQYEDVTIIPLHPPPSPGVGVGKPPLPPLPPRAAARAPVPPRRRETPSAMAGGEQAARRIDRVGLLETDLDADVLPVVQQHNGGKKARSLLSLGEMNRQQQARPTAVRLEPPPGSGAAPSPDVRARSMEFLLDKENQAAVQPPENELQKVGAGERVMSEHQLRVQRSLQKLNIPDWYKNSNAARTPEGFLLKRGSDAGQTTQGWPGLGSKTTSLSSLGSTQSAAARSPTSELGQKMAEVATGHLLSPSPTPHVFTRWSTSRLNSGGTSASTSPCGSVRSSFNYRQPYLGWRSQERLARPRTPAERLAAGILPAQSTSPGSVPQSPTPLMNLPLEEPMPQVPNLSEVRTSIKEVTSAIVHYVSGVRDGSGEALAPPARNGSPRWDRDTPSPRVGSVSPRGSGRLCWLESSFVGSRPLDSPETPLTLAETDVVSKASKMPIGGDLYLELNNAQHQHFNSHLVNGEYLLR